MDVRIMPLPDFNGTFTRGVEDGKGVVVGGPGVVGTGIKVIVVVVNTVGVFGITDGVCVNRCAVGPAGSDPCIALQVARNKSEITATAFFMPTPI
jgi:hypothetical protein